MLNPKIQYGKKLPKWKSRSRIGLFLGFSSKRPSQVGLICNLNTQWILPQYHVVYEDKPNTVPSTGRWWKIDVRTGDDSWTEIF